MEHQATRRGDLRACCLVAFTLAAAAAPLEARTQREPLANAPGSGDLRTFQLPKPAAPASKPMGQPDVVPLNAPATNESLRTMVGLGYVQGAGWGSEVFASGNVLGTQVELNSLVTQGREGFKFDHGTLSVFDPDRKWRVELGDVFSHLRGAAMGGRISWAAAANRRSAISVYAPRHGMLRRGTAISYREQIELRGHTALDAEIASDKSYLLSGRVSSSRLQLEGFFRSVPSMLRSRDASVSGGVTLWRGVGLHGSISRSVQPDDRSQWRTVAVRLPIARFLDLTLERVLAGSREMSTATSAASASLAAGELRLFHRYQHGDYASIGRSLSDTLEQQQTRTMTSYSPGTRFNFTLQLATQRADSGRVQHWEELQLTVKLTAKTTLRTVTSVPDVRNPERFQAYLRQDLPRGLSLRADYGRISAYQSVIRGIDRPRFKLMLSKTIGIATPARGATVSGRVLDDTGRGVAGARVKLGRYTAETDTSGSYTFRQVPKGEYELSLDPQHLPADYAWDGRIEQVSLTSAATVTRDLRVTPLNAVHGRIYVDRNGNGRSDANEGLPGIVVRIGERLTATDPDGHYSFYNLWPATYTMSVHSVPRHIEAPQAELTVTLRDGAPVTGADFRLLPRSKPIVWEKLSR